MNTNLLKKHAKSFYWSSFFMSREILYKCSSLYNFCRTLDDLADDKNRLDLKRRKFFKFKEDFINKNFDNPIIKEMWSIVQSENISEKVIIDLFNGVETDLQEIVLISSKKDLLVYSYRVAGTVGLMMSKILRVKNKEALKGAIDLGIAMQLTNIARDVNEDKNLERQYIKPNFSSIQETIKQSEIFYEKSFNSISCIPIRSRFSVLVARRVYKKIGDYILKQKNIENYNKAGKIYVPIFGKLIETFLSIFDFIKLLFVKEINYNNKINRNILEEEINLNERV